jgi:hypothetical protein
MNQNTLDIYAKIMADAQAKAEAQANGKKVTAPKQVTPKPTKPMVSDIFPDIKPTPELSSVTIDDLIGNKPQPVPVLIPSTQPNIKVIQYSNKCIVVVGDTKANKDKLKSLGGSFNQWLKCGAGWVFPKYKEAIVRSAFNL